MALDIHKLINTERARLAEGLSLAPKDLNAFYRTSASHDHQNNPYNVMLIINRSVDSNMETLSL